MKTSLLFGAALTILGVTAAQLIAQTQSTSTTTSSSGYVQTSKIVGTKVKTAQGEEIGVVKDIVIDRSTGCMAYTVVSAGGTGTRVTGQAKLVAVPWVVYTVTSEPSVLVVTVGRERIYNAPVFEYSRVDEYATTGYISNVYSHFGVSAQAGVSGQTSGTGTATTTAGASASPTATASPAATAAGVTGTASPMATATASPRGAASPKATAAESPTRGRAKPSATPETSRRHGETATGEKTEESPAETAISPSKERGKTSRKRATEERTEPGATPKVIEEQE